MKKFDKKVTTKDLTITLPGRTATLYKMHGDISAPHDTVLIKDDYEEYERTHNQFLAAFHGDLVTKTFLFLGLSFTDPNLDYILGRMRVMIGKDRRDHFYITRRVARKDFPNSEDGDKDYQYAKVKQDLKIEDLKRYGVLTILVDEYSKIAEILTELNRRLCLNTVFISGSASNFDPLGQPRLESICRSLGSALIQRDLKIISGSGLGIGSAVILGAVQAIYSESNEIGDRLTITHFPQTIEGEAQRETIYTQYRQRMIKRSGYSIFISGNKSKEGSIVDSGGVLEEFKITMELKKYPIPIGCTGHVAEKKWKEMNGELRRYYSKDKLSAFETLNKPDSSDEQVVNAVMDIIATLRDSR
jgi:hypothetical protein